jgi:hypothetical protein
MDIHDPLIATPHQKHEAILPGETTRRATWRRTVMRSSTVKASIRAGSAFAGLLGAALTGQAAAQQNASAPDFSSSRFGWLTFNGDFIAVPGSPSPMRNDPAHPNVPNNSGRQPTYRIGDLANPNLKPWAKEVMKKDNDEILAGKIAFTPRSSCRPAGIPGFILFGFQPTFFVQTPKEVVMIYSGDEQVRHVYLDVPHSTNPKPSWYGESVGHYEGDTLVVDTIGLNDRTFVDTYRTPHTDKLHVVERWRMIDDGKKLEATVTVDDPETYFQPWSGFLRYDRVQRPLTEEVCAENNQHLFDYHIPVADKPDF